MSAARTPFEYPLEAHADDAVAAIGWDRLREELAREAGAWLEAVELVEGSREDRVGTRLLSYMRQTRRTGAVAWDDGA